jgi:anti-sigma B factor antagonist
MELKERKLGQWKVLTPAEARLDAYVAEAFKKALTAAMSDGTKDIIMDLSSVTFMDSSGLGALVYCRQRVGQDGHVVIAGARSEVSTLLKLTHLDKVFPLLKQPEDVSLEIA